MSAESNLDIEALRTQWKKSEMEGKAEIQRLQQTLNAERKLRERLSEEVSALQTKIEEICKREDTSLVQKCQTPEDIKENKTTPERQDPPPSQTRGSSTQNEDHEKAKQTEETETSAGPWIKVGKKNGKKQREHNQITRPHNQRAKSQSGEQHSNNPPQLRYQTVVLGDSNAHRLKKHLYKKINDQRLRITTKSGATTNETLLRAEGEIARADASNIKLQLVIHVGTVEALSDTGVERSVEQLTEKLLSWNEKAPQHHYVISAIPELKSRGPQAETACRKWNQEIKNLCASLGPRIEFLTTGDDLNQDSFNDIHYTEATGNYVSTLLAQKIAPFLGNNKHEHTITSQNRRRPKGTDQMTVRSLLKAMSTALGQLSQTRRH